MDKFGSKIRLIEARCSVLKVVQTCRADLPLSCIESVRYGTVGWPRLSVRSLKAMIGLTILWGSC